MHVNLALSSPSTRVILGPDGRRPKLMRLFWLLFDLGESLVESSDSSRLVGGLRR